MDDPIARVLRSADDPVVLEGFHATKHALRFGARVHAVFAADPVAANELCAELAPDLAHEFASLVRSVSTVELRAHSTTKVHTKLIAIAERRTWSLSDVRSGPGILPSVLLDDPRNLGNVGAVIRVAAAADSPGVMIHGDVDPFSSGIVRGAAGLQFALPVLSGDRLDELVGARPITAFDADGDVFDPADRIPHEVFAFGSERTGLSATVLDRAARVVSLPMRHGVSSMNLATSVSAAIYLRRYSEREDAPHERAG